VCGDYGAEHEMVDTLVELATMKRSPWLQQHDWSADAQSLRELDIRAPWSVNDELTWNHFKSMHLVDKCVSLAAITSAITFCTNFYLRKLIALTISDHGVIFSHYLSRLIVEVT